MGEVPEARHRPGPRAVYPLDYRRTQVDGGPIGGYLVEAKWAGRNDAASKNPPCDPADFRYNEERCAVSNRAAADAFESLFRTHFPNQVGNGTLRVIHVPGNGM
ncbi:hypothetical protein ABZ816_30710 [Actinosynnema sp. NPDC047251]|uniref:hypothetical protein n=1 Tax=Saccharothrix espanaensis TaxID=103731 RepID=UPI0002FE08D4|nr:hypothetical protein [Saccharothrix espanaensis]